MHRCCFWSVMLNKTWSFIVHETGYWELFPTLVDYHWRSSGMVSTSCIIFSMVLTKLSVVYFWNFGFSIFNDFCWKFQINHCIIMRNLNYPNERSEWYILFFRLRGTGKSTTYMGYLWPCSVQGHFGVFRWSFLKMIYISKMFDCRTRQTKCTPPGH